MDDTSLKLESSSSLSSDWFGDITLIYSRVDEITLPQRMPDSQWQVLTENIDWQLWQQPAGNRWRGYPVTAVKTSEWAAWLIGEFYGRDDHEGLLNFVSGRLPASELNGHFQIWAWNRVEQQWHIWTDRFGTFHSYYCHNGRQAVLSTYSPAAAAISRRQLDWQALTGFFAFGFFPQDLTYFADVKMLRPATHYVFDQQGRLCRQKRYWNWTYEPDHSRDYEAAVADFASIFGEVMQDLLQGRVAVPISGGLDSRSTVAAMNNDKSKSIWSYAYGFTPDSAETRIATEIAETRHLPFQAFTISPYLFENLELVTASVEGFQDVTQCRQADIVQNLSAQVDYVIAAHWGDVWLDDMGLLAQAATATKEDILRFSVHKMKKRGREWLINHICLPQLTQEPNQLLAEMLRAELKAVSHIKEPDFMVKALKTDFWSWRWTTASLRMFQPGAFPRLPFYDIRLANYFCTIPSGFVAERQLQVDYLKQFAPDLARIRWQPFDTNLYRTQYFHSWLLPKRAWKKAWRKVTRERVIQRNWELQFLSEKGKQGLQKWLLRPGLHMHEFVPATAVQTLLEEFWARPQAGNGYTVSMLLTFSAWLEQYG